MANSRATCCLLCLDVFLFLFLLLMVARSFHLAMNIAQTCLESTNQMSIWLVRPAIMNNQTLFLFLFLFSIMSWMMVANEAINHFYLSFWHSSCWYRFLNSNDNVSHSQKFIWLTSIKAHVVRTPIDLYCKPLLFFQL